MRTDEAVRCGCGEKAAPEPSGGFTAGRRGDHGVKRGCTSSSQDERPYVERDLVERLVVRVRDEPVELLVAVAVGEAGSPISVRASVITMASSRRRWLRSGGGVQRSQHGAAVACACVEGADEGEPVEGRDSWRRDPEDAHEIEFSGSACAAKRMFLTVRNSSA